MTRNEDDEMAQLERVNAELKASLRQCRKIVRDCHSRLAANSNETQPDEERENQAS